MTRSGTLNPVIDQLEKLREVQRLDEQIHFFERETANLQRDVDEAQLQHDRVKQKTSAAEADKKSRRMEMDRLELELKGEEEKIARLNTQLNQVKTNKEYATLQHEIAVHTADASRVEDQMLSLMEEMDGAEQARAGHAQELAVEEARVQEARAHVDGEKAAIEGKIAALREQRAAAMANVEPGMQQVYERLMTTRDGRAMVRAVRVIADDRSCSGCFMRLTPNTSSMLMRGDSLVRCHSCGRILYIDDEEETV